MSVITVMLIYFLNGAPVLLVVMTAPYFTFRGVYVWRAPFSGRKGARRSNIVFGGVNMFTMSTSSGLVLS